MRVTWRGLELPTRVERDTVVSSEKYGRFFIEPFEQLQQRFAGIALHPLGLAEAFHKLPLHEPVIPFNLLFLT